MLAFSIKQKIIVTLTVLVVITAVSIGTLSIFTARTTISDRVLNTELPSTVTKIASDINAQIKNMQTIASQVANDPYIHDWVENGETGNGEALLIDKLGGIALKHGLSSVSFADKSTNKYWDQNGFKRVLSPGKADSWYFAYVDSNAENMVSMHTSSNSGKTNLFVNFQQTNGRGLSGTARSFDDVITTLKNYRIEQTGFVYLLDAKGFIQLHNDPEVKKKTTLADLYEKELGATLLNKKAFSLVELEHKGKEILLATGYIPNMDWYLVAEVPTEELFASINSAIWKIALWSIAIVIVGFILANIISSSVSKPIDELANLFQRLGEGGSDLSYRLSTDGQKEVALVADGYNKFVDKLETVFNDVAANGVDLHEVSKKLKQDAESTMHDVELGTASTIKVAEQLENVSTSTTEVVSNADNANEISQHIATNGKKIADVISNSQIEINQLASKINDVSSVIKSLTTNTETIAGTLATIQAISDQTNLLALNAAIEAARAGDQGRGFAVVADEVRTLAHRTANSTKEIQGIMDELMQSSENATTEINSIVEQSKSSSSSIAVAQEILVENRELFEQIGTSCEQVSHAVGGQSHSIDSINGHMDEMRGTASRNVKSVQQITNQISNLDQLASHLELLMSEYQK
ncbi:methyl-accepting chemotaxis protein [Agaribacter marinus]|uniref:Energy taxis-modulating methyl-accepting chemotaxis protein with Cache_1 sensory domain n=1 Tax=Agaribacter marinus TaxID=1431249 RepID=A0AA37WL90_9ALTE|nr:methyl-accepting chemotaxis protein [Agaribacter marinus]GLR71750.1 energy taxis-modulating methyl-accepting chemotaxis protein with Cache_1 sensory domain [Agaribacter marinus]